MLYHDSLSTNKYLKQYEQFTGSFRRNVSNLNSPLKRKSKRNDRTSSNPVESYLDVYFGFVSFEWLWSNCRKSHVARWFVRTTLLWQCWRQAGFVHWMFHGTNENALKDWKSCCCLSILKLEERPIWQQNHFAVWKTQTEKHHLFDHGPGSSDGESSGSEPPGRLSYSHRWSQWQVETKSKTVSNKKQKWETYWKP